MTKKEKVKQLSLQFTTNQNDWFSAFRHNMFILIDDGEITLRWISEEADIPYSTLNSILYGSVQNPRADVIIKIAKALGLSIDELVGAETIEPETRECIALSRNLNEHNRYVIRSFVRHQYNTHGNKEGIEKEISVFLPECKNGHLLTTNIYKPLVIDHLDNSTRSRVCMGIKVPCHHYEPYYMKNEILLLGSDRDGFNNEKCVVSHNGNYYICIKKITTTADGKKDIKYVSLMDGHNVLFTPSTIDDKIGYVVGFMEPDNPNDENTTYTWGKR